MHTHTQKKERKTVLQDDEEEEEEEEETLVEVLASSRAAKLQVHFTQRRRWKEERLTGAMSVVSSTSHAFLVLAAMKQSSSSPVVIRLRLQLRQRRFSARLSHNRSSESGSPRMTMAGPLPPPAAAENPAIPARLSLTLRLAFGLALLPVFFVAAQRRRGGGGGGRGGRGGQEQGGGGGGGGILFAEEEPEGQEKYELGVLALM